MLAKVIRVTKCLQLFLSVFFSEAACWPFSFDFQQHAGWSSMLSIMIWITNCSQVFELSADSFHQHAVQICLEHSSMLVASVTCPKLDHWYFCLSNKHIDYFLLIWSYCFEPINIESSLLQISCRLASRYKASFALSNIIKCSLTFLINHKHLKTH